MKIDVQFIVLLLNEHNHFDSCTASFIGSMTLDVCLYPNKKNCRLESAGYLSFKHFLSVELDRV